MLIHAHCRLAVPTWARSCRRRGPRTGLAAAMAADGAPAMPEPVPWWTRLTRWTSSDVAFAAAAEKGLLSSYLRTPFTLTDVKVGPGKQDFMHTIETGSSSTAGASAGQGAPPVVMMPGYGAGAAFFWRNVDGLSSHFKLWLVDWLGTGLSGRPPFKATSQAETEAFFLESLAKWRHQVGMASDAKMVLVGHSLGGYLSACYALKHPEHVAHLILVCPAGVPKAPEDWGNKMLGGATGWKRAAFKASMWAWESGVTPQTFIRGLGPWGSNITDGYVTRRFLKDSGATELEAAWFKRYFFSIIAAKGSGEYALRHLLAPGAWAHQPLVQRLKELKVPVTFIYGRNDWMRFEHAVDLCKELKQEREPKTASDLHVEVIDDSGHFVFVDQPELFNRALVDACKMHMEKGKAAQASAAVGAAAGAHVSEHNADSTTWEHGEPRPKPQA